MNRQNLQSQLQHAANQFTDQVVALFGEALTSIVRDIGLGLEHARAHVGRKPSAASTANARRPTGRSNALHSRAGRRTSSELADAGGDVLRLLQQHPDGMRIEEINRILGTNTRQLMRPIKKLLDAKQMRKTGERRSTTYFAT